MTKQYTPSSAGQVPPPKMFAAFGNSTKWLASIFLFMTLPFFGIGQSIVVNTSTSECTYNEVSGDPEATVTVDVAWSGATATDIIEVSMPGAVVLDGSTKTIDPMGNPAGAEMVTFLIISTGVSPQLVEAEFQSGSAMGINTATVPDPCCPAPIEFCPSGGETIVLEAPPNLTNYQWYFDDGMGGGAIAINGATNDTYEASMVGTYSWTAFDPDACDIGSCCPIELIEKTIAIDGAAPAMCVYNAAEDRSETIITVDFSWTNISSDGMGDFEDIEVIMTGGTVFGSNVQTIDPMSAADNAQVMFTMLADGSGPYTVEVRFVGDILCRATAEITPPLPEECPPCGITEAMADCDL